MKKCEFLSNIFNKKSLYTFFLLNLGSLLSAGGIYFFRFPNNFSIGGVTGLSVVVSYFFPDISTGTLVILMNVLLLILGFIFIGRSFGAKTVYTSLMISFLIFLFENVFPMTAPMTDEPLLELVFAVALPSVGTAILFNIQASTGGTDIIAMIFAKYTTINISKSLMYSDLLITLGAFFFGIKTGLISILGLVLKTLVIDNVIENINLHKYLTIITSKPEEVRDFIMQKVHKGATVLTGEGAFTGEKKTILLTVTTPAQAVILRRYIRTVDPKAFVFITNTSEIIGKGFRGMC